MCILRVGVVTAHSPTCRQSARTRRQQGSGAAASRRGHQARPALHTAHSAQASRRHAAAWGPPSGCSPAACTHWRWSPGVVGSGGLGPSPMRHGVALVWPRLEAQRHLGACKQVDHPGRVVHRVKEGDECKDAHARTQAASGADPHVRPADGRRTPRAGRRASCGGRQQRLRCGRPPRVGAWGGAPPRPAARSLRPLGRAAWHGSRQSQRVMEVTRLWGALSRTCSGYVSCAHGRPQVCSCGGGAPESRNRDAQSHPLMGD